MKKMFVLAARSFGEAQAASITIEASSRTEAHRLLRSIDSIPHFQPVGSFAKFERHLVEIA